MKKSDLKNGNVVELRNGDFYVLANVYNESILITLKGKYHFNLNNYSIDLTQICGFEKFDIMKVYKDYTCKELLWERKEKPQLTEDEKVILRNLPKEYKWIARDSDNLIYMFRKKPCKHHNIIWSDGYKFTFFPFGHLFQFIQWEDEEPYSIEELLGEDK